MTQYGMSTQQHDAIDKSALDKYFERVYESVLRHKGGTIVDTFSGGGRDIMNFYMRLDGDGNFAAIDSEAQKIVDMLSKNAAWFEFVSDQNRLNDAFNWNAIAVIQGRFPDNPLGNFSAKSDINLKADFMLCNAGIMFVKPDDLEGTLKAMSGMLAVKGEMAVRFSLARDDKQQTLGKSYFIHDPDVVKTILEGEGLEVTRHDDLSDPDGRPFTWVDMQALKI